MRPKAYRIHLLDGGTLRRVSAADILLGKRLAALVSDLAINVTVGHSKIAEVTFFEHALVTNS